MRGVRGERCKVMVLLQLWSIDVQIVGIMRSGIVRVSGREYRGWRKGEGHEFCRKRHTYCTLKASNDSVHIKDGHDSHVRSSQIVIIPDVTLTLEITICK